MDDKKPTLPIHEWLAVCLVSLIMLTISVVSHISWKSKTVESTFDLKEEQVEVFVEGAVPAPQSYIVKKGTRLRDIIAMADLSPEAHPSKLKLDAKVRDGQVVKVPTRPMITIFIEGAVLSTGPLQVPKGTTYADLLDKLTFKPGANLKPLQKKAKLKDGACVTIPQRN